MDVRQLKQFSQIEGVKRNPNSNEDNKLVSWNNDSGYYDYVLVGEANIDIDYFTTFVTNIFENITTDDYLNSITRINNIARFNLLSGTYHDLNLGALAWEDTVESTLILPGDTKVLFDDNDTIGGEDSFTYNKTNNRLQFEGTSISFDLVGGTEGTYKEGLKYNGTYSWSVGNSSASILGGTANITSGYRAGQPLNTGSARNSIYGPYAGELMSSTAIGSIFIGSYAGRYANTSNEFFLDNTDHGDTATAISDSFLYADLDTERRLYIRDRLSVEKEGKFGYSELSDAEGEYGMYQMSAISAGNPQWHDGTVWQDFANSINTYLNDYDLTGSMLTLTLNDLSEVGPIDLSTINTTTFATSPSSPSTGQTATSDYGYIQISNSAFTNNEGFTYKAGFSYNNTLNEVNIPGALKLATKAQYTASNGNVIYDGTHYYGRLGAEWKQLDNEPTAESTLEGVNLGDGPVEWYYTKSDDGNLLFRTFDTIPLGNVYNPNDRMHLAYTDDGYTAMIGTTAERNRLSTTIDDPASDKQIEKDNVGETLHIRALRQGTGVILTQTENYILIDATGAGGGEVNTASNVGSGIGHWAYKNGVDLEFYTLLSTDDRLKLTQATDHITDPENLARLNLTVGANTTPLVTSVTDSDTVFYQTVGGGGISPTIWFKRLISDTITFTTTVNNELRLETGSAAATGTNLPEELTTSIPIYVKGSAPDFEFKTLNTVGLNSHINITENGDGETIDFNVDDLIYIFNTSATGLELLTGTSGFNILSKGINVTASSGLTTSESTDNDIIIDQPILIPKFSFTPTPAFTAGAASATPITATTGLLEFKVNYINDTRDGSSPVASVLHTLNIGAGLAYDAGSNTLSSVNSGENTATDYYLTSATLSTVGTDYKVDFAVGDALSPASLATYSVNIPIYQPNIADYTDSAGSTGDFGGVKILEKNIIWENSTQRHLTLDDVTGKVSIEQELVTYDTQNNLHDIDNTIIGINDKRDVARANMGSAYINGSSIETFATDDLNVSGAINATILNEVHSIGNLQIEENRIRGTQGESIWEYSDGSVSKVTMGYNSITLQTNSNVRIKDSDGKIKFLMNTDSGDLYVAGKIIAGGDIQGGDTDELSGAGITAIS